DANNATVNIRGAADSERVHLEFGQTDAATGLAVNLYLDGGGDEAWIQLSSAVERLDLAPTSGQVHAANYTMQVNGAETIHANGGGGLDVLGMTDGPGEDVVESSPTLTSMTRSGVYRNEAFGFERITIDANLGESNRATLYGNGNTSAVMNGPVVTTTDFSG